MKNTKLYSIYGIYNITLDALRTIKYFKIGRKKEIISKKMTERIMLAVTAVNDCEMCSYGHTKMALNAGLSNDEIKAFLQGEFLEAPKEELKAIMFAQNYADEKTKIEQSVWNALLDEYKEEKSLAILGAIRMITMGNAYGIVFSSIKNRFKKGKGDKRSNIFYEICVVVLFLPMILVSFFHGLIKNILNRPLIKFKKL